METMEAVCWASPRVSPDVPSIGSAQNEVSWRPIGLQSSMDRKTSYYAEDVDDDPTGASSSHLHFLLRQQDEYIEQLELENKTLKNELKSIQSTARQITNENQRILQNWKMDIFRHLLPKKEEKGMSDEEKVFYGRESPKQRNVSKDGCVEHELKIKHLEGELSQIRKSLESLDKTNAMTPSTSDQYKINLPKKEWDDLLEINSQLRETVNDMRLREDEAQNQIKKGIQLVEEAHLQKTEAITEREQLKNDLIQQKKRNDDLRTEYEQRMQAEQNRTTSAQQKMIEEAENERSVTNQTLERLKVNLERVNREKRELEQRYEQTERHHEAVNEDLRKAIAGLRAEETKLRIEQNGAFREVTNMRDAWERSKQEQLQEVILLKSDLSEANVRLKRMERDYLQAKGEVAGMAGKVLYLETEMNHSAQQQKHVQRSHSDYVGSNDTELFHRNDGLERVIEQQMHLVSDFRYECKRLAEQLDRLSDQSKQSINTLKSQNSKLCQNVLVASEKCKRLEAICKESEEKRGDMSEKLQSMKKETAKQSQKMIDLLQKQTQLLKDRQFLHEEMHFLHEKLNA